MNRSHRALRALHLALLASLLVSLLPYSPAPVTTPPPLQLRWPELRGASELRGLPDVAGITGQLVAWLFAQPADAQGNPPTEAAPAGTELNPPYLFSGSTASGVQTFTGNFSFTRTVLSIPGRGPSPALTLAYNSNDTRVGPLGPGWTTNYHIRVRNDGSGNALLVGAQGRSDRYSAPSWTLPAGVTTKLAGAMGSTWTATTSDQTVFNFNASGNLTSIVDRYGNTSTLTYDGNGRLSSVSDPAGRGTGLTFAYDATSGRLTSVTDFMTPTARVVQFGYDASNRISTITDRESKVTSLAYDGTSARITTITNALSQVQITNTFDGSGRVSTQKDAKGLTSGQQTSFTYPSPGPSGTTVVTYPPASYDANWNPKVEDTHDANGRLTQKLSKPSAPNTEWTPTFWGYDSNGFLAWSSDLNSNVTEYCYDTDYAGAATTHTSYRGNLTRVIGPAATTGGNRPVALTQYDAKNNVIQSYPPRGVGSGATVTCSTNFAASLTAAFATDSTYDSATSTKLESVTRHYVDPDSPGTTQNATTKYEYGDTANPGMVTRAIPPLGNTGGSPDYTYATTSTYGTTGCQAGLLTSTTTPNPTDSLGDKTTFEYDCGGREIKRVDPNGNITPGGVPADHTWETAYDKEDRVVQRKAPAPTTGGAQLITQLQYDAVGNRTVVIDASGQVSKHLSDERNLLQYVQTSPSAWTNAANPAPTPRYVTERVYGHLGELTRVLRYQDDSIPTRAATERAADRKTDGLGQVRSVLQYPSWPQTDFPLTTAYTYDANGNRLTTTNPQGQTTSYAYDKRNRLTGVTYSDGTPNVTHGYDLASNRSSMADDIGTTTSTYDELDRVTQVDSPGSVTVKYRYDLNGNRRKIVYPDTAEVNYSFDKANRMSSLTDGSRTTSYTYTRDHALATITNFTANGTSTAYTYDNAGRMTEVWNKYGSLTISKHTYTLDAVGNRTQVVESLPRLGVPISRLPTPEDTDPADLLLAALDGEPLPEPGVLRAAALPEAPVAQTPGPQPGGTGPRPTPADELESIPTVQDEPDALPPIPPAGAPVRVDREAAERLPLADQRTDARASHLYRAEQAGYRAELFERGREAANVRLSHAASGTSLSFELPGAAASRQATGADATVQVGNLQVRWTSYTDRLKEAIILASRPPVEQISFRVQKSGLTFTSDGAGGYRAQTASGEPVFHILAPTIHDAAGRTGRITLTLTDTQGTLAVDAAFLASAQYPVTIDPTLIYTASGSNAVSLLYNTSPRLLRDALGKLLLLSNNNGTATPSWSNDGGVTWSSGASGLPTGATAPSWELTPDGAALEMVCQCDGAITYGRWTIQRSTSSVPDITGLTPPASLVTLASSGERPSLVIDKNGLPAVAWIYRATGAWEVRFLRAKGDPSTAAGWVNAQATSASPDALGSRSANAGPGAVTLARMPRTASGTSNDDALYLFWTDHTGLMLRWSKATTSALNYSAWTTPSNKEAIPSSADLSNAITTAPDAKNGAIAVGYANNAVGRFKLIRKQASNDSDASDATLVAGSAWPAVGATDLNLGVDRGDVYVFYNLGANLERRQYLPETGLSAATTVSTTAQSLTVRRTASDGALDLAFVQSNATTTYVLYQGARGARPLIRNLATTMGSFVPVPGDGTPGDSTTIKYTLSEDKGVGTVRIYDSSPTLVRTLVNGSQSLVWNGTEYVFTFQHSWDGKNDGGSFLSAGTYTVKVNTTDAEGFPAPEQTLPLVILGSRTITLTYTYDKLGELLTAADPGGTTTYTYDPVGNRASMLRGGITTAYSYDRADRIDNAGAADYAVDFTGNTRLRGTSTLSYDQANRITRTGQAGKLLTYRYNGDGVRVESRSDGTLTSSRYALGAGLPVLLTDTTGSAVRSYIWGKGLLYTIDSTGAVESYHTDGLGSVRALTNGSGVVIGTERTDAYGNLITKQGTTTQVFGYTGEQYDSDTGLVYLRARMYDPRIGRFLQRDRGLGGYVYADNNPTLLVDPSGNDSAQCPGCNNQVAPPCMVTVFGVCPRLNTGTGTLTLPEVGDSHEDLLKALSGWP